MVGWTDLEMERIFVVDRIIGGSNRRRDERTGKDRGLRNPPG
jgi:hypothetical protein